MFALQTETQRGGLVFIYNMSGSKYSNFDYDLSQKLLTLLKGAYPARLKKVLIVTAPLWFKAPFKVRLLNWCLCVYDQAAWRHPTLGIAKRPHFLRLELSSFTV